MSFSFVTGVTTRDSSGTDIAVWMERVWDKASFSGPHKDDALVFRNLTPLTTKDMAYIGELAMVAPYRASTIACMRKLTGRHNPTGVLALPPIPRRCTKEERQAVLAKRSQIVHAASEAAAVHLRRTTMEEFDVVIPMGIPDMSNANTVLVMQQAARLWVSAGSNKAEMANRHIVVMVYSVLESLAKCLPATAKELAAMMAVARALQSSMPIFSDVTKALVITPGADDLVKKCFAHALDGGATVPWTTSTKLELLELLVRRDSTKWPTVAKTASPAIDHPATASAAEASATTDHPATVGSATTDHATAAAAPEKTAGARPVTKRVAAMMAIAAARAAAEREIREVAKRTAAEKAARRRRSKPQPTPPKAKQKQQQQHVSAFPEAVVASQDIAGHLLPTVIIVASLMDVLQQAGLPEDIVAASEHVQRVALDMFRKAPVQARGIRGAKAWRICVYASLLHIDTFSLDHALELLSFIRREKFVDAAAPWAAWGFPTTASTSHAPCPLRTAKFPNAGFVNRGTFASRVTEVAPSSYRVVSFKGVVRSGVQLTQNGIYAIRVRPWFDVATHRQEGCLFSQSWNIVFGEDIAPVGQAPLRVHGMPDSISVCVSADEVQVEDGGAFRATAPRPKDTVPMFTFCNAWLEVEYREK